MSHWRTYLDSDVIRFVDLNDQDQTLQIKSVKKGKVVGSGGKSSGKCMITFEGRDKPMGCGTAILTQIAALYGNEVKNWVGKWITIWPDPSVSFGGAKVGGIRVRPSVPKDGAVTVTAGKAEKPGAGKVVTADDVAASRAQIDADEAAEIAKQEAANG